MIENTDQFEKGRDVSSAVMMMHGIHWNPAGNRWESTSPLYQVVLILAQTSPGQSRDLWTGRSVLAKNRAVERVRSEARWSRNSERRAANITGLNRSKSMSSSLAELRGMSGVNEAE